MYNTNKNYTLYTILLITIILIFSSFNPIISANSQKINENQNTIDKKMIQNLPDLRFLDLKAWWGETNTTGIFVDYDVINNGSTYYSNIPIISNLSFYIYDNNSLFGYINQTPLFYPSIWYESEILGGNNFFEMSKKPDKITVIIDFENQIIESNENNNNKTILVYNGITVKGEIKKNESGELIPINQIIELNEFNNTSLSTFGYRHFLSDENGTYQISICPKEPLNMPQEYYIMAKNFENNQILINETKALKDGENLTLNLIFSGSSPDKPNKPIGRKIGKTDRKYLFLTTNSDSDNDNISYKFDWGDGSYSDWIGPFYPNKIIITNHTWIKNEKYTIKVISKDTKGMLSVWSDPLTINIPEKEFYSNFLYEIINYIKEKFNNIILND